MMKNEEMILRRKVWHCKEEESLRLKACNSVWSFGSLLGCSIYTRIVSFWALRHGAFGVIRWHNFERD